MQLVCVVHELEKNDTKRENWLSEVSNTKEMNRFINGAIE